MAHEAAYCAETALEEQVRRLEAERDLAIRKVDLFWAITRRYLDAYTACKSETARLYDAGIEIHAACRVLRAYAHAENEALDALNQLARAELAENG